MSKKQKNKRNTEIKLHFPEDYIKLIDKYEKERLKFNYFQGLAFYYTNRRISVIAGGNWHDICKSMLSSEMKLSDIRDTAPILGIRERGKEWIWFL